jgi:hypothetical protein
MADHGKGTWPLRNAQLQNITTTGRDVSLTDKEQSGREYSLSMDRSGRFIIAGKPVEAVPPRRNNIPEYDLDRYTELDGAKIDIEKPGAKIKAKDGTISLVERVTRSNSDTAILQIRKYDPVSQTQIMAKFTDLDGKPLHKDQTYGEILKHGVVFKVQSILKDEGRENWEIYVDRALNPPATRRISEQELAEDFRDKKGKPLDFDSIRAELTKSTGRWDTGR